MPVTIFSPPPLPKEKPHLFFSLQANLDCEQSLFSSKIRGKERKTSNMQAWLWAWIESGDAASR